MMNVNKKECKVHNTANNPSMKSLKPLCSMQCVAAFYSSRFITSDQPTEGGSYALDLDAAGWSHMDIRAITAAIARYVLIHTNGSTHPGARTIMRS